MNRYKVVLTSTNEATRLYEETMGELVLLDKPIKTDKPNYNRHMHIVDTKATIEVGDWYLDGLNALWKATKEDIKTFEYSIEHGFPVLCTKVIASTDKSLGLPFIPNDLIKAYVAEPFEYADKWYSKKTNKYLSRV